MMNVVDLSEYIVLLLLDSIATRAQSFLFGANVPKGSIFALLQSVGMKMKGFFLAFLKFVWPF